MIENYIIERISEKKEIFKSNQIFPHIVFDNFLEKELSERIYEEIKNSSEKGMPYFGYNFKKYALNDESEFGKETRKLINYLNSNDFTLILEKLTSIENLVADEKMEGGGLHFVKKGGYLNIHSDFESHIISPNYKRRLNLLLYFNKHWSKENNGNIEFWDRNLNNKVDYEPIHNRAIIFQTDRYSYHGHPGKLKPPTSDNIRKSIALYYYTIEKEDLPLKETNFVALNNESFIKKILMNTDQYALRVYSYLKRNRLMSDKFAINFMNKIIKLIYSHNK
jgi:Rps23 Pro-64 3,4-dihydroxylase Tpa1-like proline 4-hydroxylase